MIITLILMIGAVVLATVPLIAVFLYNAAKNKQQASFVREATIEFVMAGERVLRVLENVRGWYYDGREFVETTDPSTGAMVRTPLTFATKVGKISVPETRNLDGAIITPAAWTLEPVNVPVQLAILPGDPAHRPNGWRKKVRQYFRHKWGFFWVSAVYPQRHIHKFQVVKSRLRRDFEEGGRLTEMVQVDATPAEVDHLLWRFPRAVYIGNIEFADRLTASLVVLSNFQVVMPSIPVFTYKADFFPQIESLVRTIVINYCRKIKLADFIKSSPIGPDSTGFFAQIVSQVNPEMIRQYGVHIESSWIVEIELGDSEEQKALRAQELAELNGRAAVRTAELGAEAVLATAQGAAKATVVKAEAEAIAITAKGAAEAGVLKTKVDQAGAAVVIEDLHRLRVAEFKGSVLSEGGATSAGVMVSLPAKPEQPATPPATPP